MSDVEVLNPVSKINIKCAGALEINQFNFSRAHPKSRRRNYLPYSRKCVSGTSVCLRLMVMASVNLVPVDKTPLDEAGVSYGRHHCLSPLMCRPRPPPPPRPPLLDSPTTTHIFQPIWLEPLKYNQPGHAPLLPIIRAFYPHLSLYFLFLPALFHLISL